MKKIVGLVGLLVLFGGTAAIAQSGGKETSTAQPTTGGVVQAPIGHRQPRASDVPNEKNLGNPNDPITKEDAALDKKIKSICRGC